MKKKILLVTFISLVTLFAFGQIKNNERFGILKVEQRLKGLEKNDYQRKLGLSLLENKAYSQSPSLKSSSIKQRLDSLVSHNWNVTNSQWVKESKDEYTYDANGRWTMGVYYNWDVAASLWVRDYKDEYTYGANNRWATDINYNWNDTTSQWVRDYKYEYTYNDSGYSTVVLIYKWNDTASQWVNDSKYEYTYTTNGHITQFLISEWNLTNSQWVAMMRYDYTYDNNWNCTQFIANNWDVDFNKWVVVMKYEFTYDSNNRMIIGLYSIWNDEASLWLPMMKYEYTYDANGRTATEIRSDRDFLISQWVSAMRYEFSYDANSNNTQCIISKWDRIINQWVSYSKEVNTFDLAYTFADLIFPSGYSMIGVFNGTPAIATNNKPLEELEYLWDGTINWVNNLKTIYYYSAQNGVGVNELKADELTVYPNPVSDGFRLNTFEKNVQISIYNLSGSLLLTKQISDNEYINVSTLSQGIYMVKVTTEKGLATIKFVKK